MCEHQGAPTGGTLFSVWSMIPDEIASVPYTRGNMDVYVLRGSNWHMRCLVGNMQIDGNGEALYNANSMFFGEPSGTWAGDYSYYQSTHADGITQAQATGWVWSAWHVVVGSGSVTMRQWLKFGRAGPVFAAGESTVTFAQLRTFMVDQSGGTLTEAGLASWVPSDAVSFDVGRDHGYLVHARMDAQTVTPDLATLDAIANGTAPVDTAWADYSFDWVGAGPNLEDNSGHGRNLAVASGGAVHAGPAFTP